MLGKRITYTNMFKALVITLFAFLFLADAIADSYNLDKDLSEIQDTEESGDEEGKEEKEVDEKDLEFLKDIEYALLAQKEEILFMEASMKKMYFSLPDNWELDLITPPPEL
jgi:hypothetical protein